LVSTEADARLLVKTALDSQRPESVKPDGKNGGSDLSLGAMGSMVRPHLIELQYRRIQGYRDALRALGKRRCGRPFQHVRQKIARPNSRADV
jgi:hypothetical protein